MSGDSQLRDEDHFPEWEIVSLALKGDNAAFKEVVLLYSRRLYAVAYAVVQNPTEAEDVVQETFLKAYSRRWMIRDPEKFPAWLCRITRNRALDQVRKHRPRQLTGDDQPLEEIIDENVPRPGANLHAAERDGALQRLLDTLPDNHRIAVTLRFMEEMDYREIEKTMGINHGTVRGILARAMKTLRKGIGTALLRDITGAN